MSQLSAIRLEQIAGACEAPAESIPQPLVDVLVEEYKTALDAIVYYGSCLRSGDPTTGLVDFYVLINDRKAAGLSLISRLAMATLPPNVHYLQTTTGADATLRAKYAVMTTSQFTRGARLWFSAMIWGRFAQPVAIVYARDAAVRAHVRRQLGQAVVTLLNRALPALAEDRAVPAELFARALALSYASELRVESFDRSSKLVAGEADEYERRFLAASAVIDVDASQDADGRVSVHVDAGRTQRARRAWRWRRAQGRLLSVLRLAKACFTFSDAIDYGAWKVERHTGMVIDVTPRMRRHPVIFGAPALVRVMRRRRSNRRA